MADVDINKFRASVVRDGSKPASPGFVVSEGQDPVNPPGTNNYVPYSGATANVELGEFGVESGFITLDTTPTNTPTDQGTIFWDADDETVDIVLNGYTMKIGEDLFYPVKNQTGSTIAKGVAVRFNGTLGASGRLLIAPFIADGSVPSSRFMGVTAEEILNGEDGKVLYFGRVRGINTDAFNEGDILYASTTVAGGYQTAIPVAPNNIVQVAAVVTKHVNNGTIFVRPTLGSNLNTDEAVKLTSVADKNLLQYQSGTALWENKTLAQVLGGTSSQFVKGDGSLDSTAYGTGTVTSVGLSSATSGVTIGSTPVTTSGTITLAIATASGSQNGLLSSTDWTTFNGKQNALTNPVTGTGTTNYLPKFTGTSTIGNSAITDDGSVVTINSRSMTINAATNNFPELLYLENGDLKWNAYNDFNTDNYVLGNSGGGRLFLNQSGNLGLGVTPSAWSIGRGLDINGGMALLSLSNASFVLNNAYYNGAWIYKASSFAQNFLLNNDGSFQFNTAPSGTAGNAISFTQAMTLTSGGNLILTTGTVSDNGARLQVSGTAGAGITLRHSNGNVVALLEEFSGTQGAALTLRNSSATNNIQFNAGGVSYINGGNVGINTATPSNKLDIQSANGTTYAATPQLRVGGGGVNNSYAQILFSDNALSDGKISYFPAAAEANRFFSISARQIESDFVIRGNGNVGIGTASPNLSAGSAGSGILTVSATTSERNGILELNGTRTTNTFISGYVRFFNNGAATPLAEIRAIRGSSDTSGDLSIETSGAERVRVTSNGLTFNGDTAAANALDDYEEGTWTPTSVSGGLTLSVQTARYTKVGRLVTLQAYIEMATGGTADNIVIGGSPFANSSQGWSTGSLDASKCAKVGAVVRIEGGGTQIQLLVSSGSTTVDRIDLKGNDFGSTSYMIFTLTYQTS